MSSDATDTLTSFLSKILDTVHPLMAEALYLAAIPNWYNAALFAAMRSRDDGRNDGLITRLNRYSFIVPVPDGREGEISYSVRPDERVFLQRHWIARDPGAYRKAHQNALEYWLANPEPNPFAQAQNRLYHQLLVDPQAGMDYLVDRFRAYHNERQLAAIERLLATVDDARFYLVMLESKFLDQLDDLLAHLRSRLAQLRGRWDESLESLETLRQKQDLAPWLLPYVARAYGYALEQTGRYVESIEQYRFALELFEKETASITRSAGIQAERAHTMIAMGKAHVGLAVSIRGHQEAVRLKSAGLQRLRDFTYFFLSLPLVLYLSFFLGRRVWHPRFWPTLEDLDWIVARLFATGARLYAKADPILEQHGTPSEGVVADEQLAYLYLAMGDAEQAEKVFLVLLSEAEAPLGDYRRAVVRVGWAESMLKSRKHNLAQEQLKIAMPVLALYEDVSLSAEADMLYAEALLESRDPSKAAAHYEKALRGYRSQGNVLMMTEVAERLELLAQDTRLEPDQQEALLRAAGQISARRYPVRYRHPATVFFQRAAVGMLAALIFLILVSVIRLETGITLVPGITFNATPLLRADAPDFTPDLSQGVASLGLSTTPDTELLIWLGIVWFGGYLVLSTAVGILAIMNTSLSKVQSRARAQVVRLDGDMLQVGEGDALREIRLSDVTRYYQADLRFADSLLVDDSSTTAFTAEQRIRISANTAWYKTLRERVASRLSESSRRVDFSYDILRSRTGIIYLVTMVVLALLSVLGRFAPRIISLDMPLIRYSLADIHPYLYAGLFFPPVWWFIVRPLQIRLHADPLDRFPWWLGGVGLALALLRLALLFRPWFTVPDVYGPLLILALVIGSGIAIVRAKHPFGGKLLYSPAHRVLTVAAMLIITVLMLLNLRREVASYHYLVLGDSWRDRALGQDMAAERRMELERAIEDYGRALEISDTGIIGIGEFSAVNTPIGIPDAKRLTWFLALNNRAAMYSQLGDYSAAIKDYTDLLERGAAEDHIYADRAMAYLGQGTAPSDELGMVEVVSQSYDAALADFEKAIALEPGRAKYYLWRGVTYHALGDKAKALIDYEHALGIEGADALDDQGLAKAWTGIGWLAYADGRYAQSVDAFQEATATKTSPAEAYLGLGYAYYSLRQYDDVLRSWEQATEREPENPIIFISLGTLYWRIGTLGQDYGARGQDRCSSDSLSEAEKRESAGRLEESIENFKRSAAIPDQEPGDLAYTYRTMAQVQYLLRNCPGYDPAATIAKAVEFYSEALALDPDNAAYWHMRGRLAYTVWYNSPPGSGAAARAWLFQGLADTERALALDPVDKGDYRPNAWLVTLYNEAVEGTLNEGDRRFADGGYGSAFGYYVLVAENRVEHFEAAFKSALAAFAIGDEQNAITWYKAGIERAMAAGDEAAVQGALAALRSFSETHDGGDLASLEAVFEDSGIDLSKPLSAAVAFEWGMEALSEGRLADAEELFDWGLQLVSGTADISAAASALIWVRSEPAAEILLPAFQRAMMQLEVVVGSDDTAAEDAFKLGLIAAGIDDEVAAGKWYNEGVRRSALNGDYPPIQTSREDLKMLWAATGVKSEGLLAQMERQLPAQLAQYPELNENGLYWRFRAWFKYGVGLAAFRLEEERAARSALQSAQLDASRAFELDSSGNAYVQSYLSEGAWGWYHVERGNDRFAEEAYPAALAAYEAAADLIKPVTNRDARNEVAIAAFKAGLTSLALREPGQSERWYRQGLDLMARYGSAEQVLQDAIEELISLLNLKPELAEGGAPILEFLEQAQ